MNEPFDKHLTSNAEYWNTMLDRGYVDKEDIRKARNYYGKYSYAEQNEAVKRLNEGLSKALKNNPDHQGLQQFIASMTEASDEMIKDKVTSSFRDLDKVTDTDITLKAKKLGIPVEEFRNQFKLVKERIDTEKGRERRKKELDEMAWYNPQKWATSDYEKQRYINDPDASIIGKEGNGKWFNKGEAISDLAFGIAGAAGDMLPGWGSLVGPAVRGLRDVHHKATGSKYQKDIGNILRDVGEDALFNVAIEKTPTALLKSAEETAKNAGKFDTFMSKVNDYNNVMKEVRNNKAGIDILDWSQLHNMSDLQIEEAVKSMPDSPLKQKLKGYVDDGVEKNRDKIGETLVTYEPLSNPKRLLQQHSYYDEAGNVKPFKKDYWKEQGVEDYVRRQANASQQGKLVKGASNILDAIQSFGGNALKELKTAEGRDSMPNTSEREDIDWFKENYARDWEAGFVPRGKDDEPIIKAYREWKKENKKPSVRSVMGGM